MQSLPPPPPPPERFRAATNVRYAKELSGQPVFITRRRAKGRFLTGVRYERSGQEFLTRFAALAPGLEYRAGPWFEFQDDTGKRWCQPDGLLIDKNKGHCLIVEFKYQHTSDAWYQLVKLYLPVLRAAYPTWTFGLAEIVHFLDPSTLFPQRLNCVSTVDKLLASRGEEVGTLIFNKRREQRFLAVGCGSGASDSKAHG